MANIKPIINFANSPKDAERHYYSRYNNEDLTKALQSLSGVAFKLYTYIGMFKEHYSFVLSRQDAIEKTGISLRSYTNAVHELKEKGYLIETSKRGHFRYSEKGEPNHIKEAKLATFKSI